jgi:hypothetical protein
MTNFVAKRDFWSISPEARIKTYLILACLSITLFAYSVWTIRPVIVEPTDLLGLASLLPASYWLGLALLLLASVFVFLDRLLNKHWVFVFILCVLGLYTIGTGVFAFENPILQTAYLPSGIVRVLLESHHLSALKDYNVLAYYSWPVIHLLSASALTIFGTDMNLNFIRYAPLIWGLGFVLIAYGIGRRASLNPNQCFLISFLGLSSLSAVEVAYNPQNIAIILYLCLFMVLAMTHWYHSVGDRICAIFLFGALVLTHGLTTLAVLVPAVVLFAYRRRFKLLVIIVLLGAAALFALYIYGGGASVITRLLKMIPNPFDLGNLQWLLNPATYAPPGATLVRNLTRYLQLSYLGLYTVFGGIAFIFLILRKVKTPHKEWVQNCFFWLVGLALLTLVGYQIEGPYRLYFMGIIPAACVIALSFSSDVKRHRIALVSLMVAFLALSLLTRYGSVANYGQIPSTELKGEQFISQDIGRGVSFFYDGPNVLSFYNPDAINAYVLTQRWGFPDLQEVDLSRLDKEEYVLLSEQGHRSLLWSYGFDPFYDWPQTAGGQKANLIYNNRGFQVYTNPQS